MSQITIKLPDIGEGIAEAEITEWHVEVGAWIDEDDILCVVMTDKAEVEIPSSAAGKLLWRAADPGDRLAIGAPLVKIGDAAGVETEAADHGPPDAEAVSQDAADAGEKGATQEASRGTSQGATQEASQGASQGASLGAAQGATKCDTPQSPQPAPDSPATPPSRMRAAPAVRARARDIGLDLTRITGSGPKGRITHADLDRHIRGSGATLPPGSSDGITEIKIIGLRRKIAEQMALANERIPRITIVEEIDVTELETLRARMNDDRAEVQPKLTLLPFLIRAMIGARDAAPQINARYDDEAEILYRHDAMHIGVATQTERGLVVPVLSHAESRNVWEIAAEIARLADAARSGALARDELSGSTLTVTSLGPLGAIATTPIINAPEVAIVGVNRMQIRPLWDGHAFVPRKVMNISASFDHRIVDGWDAAHFIARLKTLLETPALVFV